jgi:alanine racemase
MTPQAYYRCWVEVDLDALRHNVSLLRQQAGPNVKLMAVVKADAYGHGLAHVGAALMRCGVDAFAVATLSEALLLRQIGGRGWPVLLFGAPMPFELAKIVEQDIMPTVSSYEEAAHVNDEAHRQGKTATVQVEVDTGMGRVGLWHEEAVNEISHITMLEHLRLGGLYTHFPAADQNVAVTRESLVAFLRTADAVRATGVKIPLLHAANSPALLNVPEATLDMVRIGLLLYGLVPVGCAAPGFRPLLAFKSRVAFVKTVEPGRTISYGQTFAAQRRMQIATVAAGYGDGFSRQLSNRAEVLVSGQRCRVVGRVTMDQIMVDVTDVPGVVGGDEVVFIGRQGEAEITASEVAGWADTIAWEILCGINKTVRVPRVYRGVNAA